MGKRDREQKQDLITVLDKAWGKWVASYPKPPLSVFKKKLSETSAADDHDSEYDVSDRLMEGDTWDDETVEGIEAFSSFLYDDSEKGKELLYIHMSAYMINYCRCSNGGIQCLES